MNSIKFYFWKILANFFKFLCKYFINFSKVFDEYICAECPPPQPKFWRRHCSTGVERNSCMKFISMFPPRTKILAPHLYTVRVYIVYLSVVTVPPPPFLYVADPMCWPLEKCIGNSLSTNHSVHTYKFSFSLTPYSV